MNSATERPSTRRLDRVLTASVQIHASSSLGSTPKGSRGSGPPAITTSAYRPFRRT